jgi:hypothetical protein
MSGRAVCRALLGRPAAHRLFNYEAADDFTLTPAPLLEKDEEVQKLRDRVATGKPAIVYFQNSLGGEIKLTATERSPAFSFDSTMVELRKDESGALTVGKYGHTKKRSTTSARIFACSRTSSSNRSILTSI